MAYSVNQNRVVTWEDLSRVLLLKQDLVRNSEALMLAFLLPSPTLDGLRQMPAAEYRRLLEEVKAFVAERSDPAVMANLPVSGSVQ